MQNQIRDDIARKKKKKKTVCHPAERATSTTNLGGLATGRKGKGSSSHPLYGNKHGSVTPRPAADRLAHIDSLRALAALMVACAHVWEGFLPVARQSRSAAGQTWPRYFDLGITGVVLFFAISGFVIYGTLRGRAKTPGAVLSLPGSSGCSRLIGFRWRQAWSSSGGGRAGRSRGQWWQPTPRWCRMFLGSRRSWGFTGRWEPSSSFISPAG